MREFGKLASRNGDLLTLRLENGASKAYRDEGKACDTDDAARCTLYRFAAYHREAHVYSIAIQYYEGSGVELVSGRTGNVLRLQARHIFRRTAQSLSS